MHRPRLLATGEAVRNAVQHAQGPSVPVIDVAARVSAGQVEIAVRDHGQ